MDEAWTLVVLSIAMLIGCYVAGSVPLSIPMSEDKLKLVTMLGAGLLVGTALAVIIPEGVHALLAPPNNEHHHDHHLEEKSLIDAPKVGVNSAVGAAGPAGVLASGGLLGAAVQDQHEHGNEELHKWIGVALVLGFVFMLLVDQIGGSIHSSSGRSSSSSSESSGGSRLRITATLGLVVHAAADGVALGAAASTSHSDVTMIVFIAIMLHKAPAAFGLASFLMHEGFDRNRIRKHLAVFAFAAPVLSIITYFGLNQRGKEALSDVNATGIAMLFSGGTFLYVATVHILPELAHRSSSPSASMLLDGGAPSRDNSHKGFSKLELLVLVIGCLLPLVLAVGHKH